MNRALSFGMRMQRMGWQCHRVSKMPQREMQMMSCRAGIMKLGGPRFLFSTNISEPQMANIENKDEANGSGMSENEEMFYQR